MITYVRNVTDLSMTLNHAGHISTQTLGKLPDTAAVK